MCSFKINICPTRSKESDQSFAGERGMLCANPIKTVNNAHIKTRYN